MWDYPHISPLLPQKVKYPHRYVRISRGPKQAFRQKRTIPVARQGEFKSILNASPCYSFRSIVSSEVNSAFEALLTIKYPLLYFSTTASFFCLANLTYDRYVFITKPLRYYSIMTNRRFALLSMTCWTFTFISMVIFPIFWHNRPSHQLAIDQLEFCKTGAVFQDVSIDELRFVAVPFCAVIMTGVAFMNWKIYKVASKIQKVYASGKNHSPSKANTSSSVESGRQLKDIDPNGKEARKINEQEGESNIAHIIGRVQNKQPFKRGVRQAKTVLIMLACFLLSWGPFLSLMSFQAYTLIFTVTLARVGNLFLYSGICNSLMNPIIYSFRMSQFRNGLKKLFMRIRDHAVFPWV